jgi:hypothetical protein
MGSISAPALRGELVSAAESGFDAEIDSESDDALAPAAGSRDDVDQLALEFGEAPLV